VPRALQTPVIGHPPLTQRREQLATAVRSRKRLAPLTPTARAPRGVFSTTTTCETPRSSTATRRVADCSEVVTRPLPHTSDGNPQLYHRRKLQEVEASRESGPVEDRNRYLRLDARVDKVRDGAQVVRERVVARTPCSKPRARGDRPRRRRVLAEGNRALRTGRPAVSLPGFVLGVMRRLCWVVTLLRTSALSVRVAREDEGETQRASRTASQVSIGGLELRAFARSRFGHSQAPG
jgi:hypothetical protein